ncbi:MAG TPA: extracellular solute-binding protein [Candidatus Lustribacter sp.]|jgi:iron(III) transport system substrate-binding protein|nr:extracellular solute-binding protein [Candidatus Lustribacter sp.]
MPYHSITRRNAIAGTAAVLAAAASPPAFAQTGSMAALVAAAKAEGSVVVDGPPINDVRDALVSGFQQAYGIPVSYISSGTSASGARVRAERSAGKYLLDVFLSGSDTPTLTFLPGGWLDKVEPVLIAPDVTDTRKWKDNHLWYEDPGHTILRVQQNVVPELAVNTKLVPAGQVTTWKSLLDPKWKGKIVAKDPASSGAGASLISYFYLMFGADFVKQLYIEQKPVLSRDARQAVQFVAEGNYPIIVGPDTPAMVDFQKLGYPLQPIFPTDAPSVLTGSWGLTCLINKAPHPSAAQLFINWFAGPAAQLAYAKATQSLSLRTDLRYTGLPNFIFPQKGTKYMDTYAYKYVTDDRDPALAKARALLGE